MNTQLFRSGDVVSILATVNRHYDHDADSALANLVTVSIDGQHSSVFVTANKLTLVTPFFSTGDKVRKKGHLNVKGEVIAMDGEMAWVRFSDGKRGTVPALEIELDPAHVVAS